MPINFWDDCYAASKRMRCNHSADGWPCYLMNEKFTTSRSVALLRIVFHFRKLINRRGLKDFTEGAELLKNTLTQDLTFYSSGEQIQ